MSVAGGWRQEGEVSMACRIWLVGSDPVVGGELEGWLTAAGFTTERLSHAEALSRLGATRPRVDRVVVDGGSHSGSLELLPHFRAAGVPVTLLLEAEDLLAVVVALGFDTIAVSIANACSYCIHSHTAAARAKGMSDAQYAELLAIVVYGTDQIVLALIE